MCVCVCVRERELTACANSVLCVCAQSVVVVQVRADHARIGSSYPSTASAPGVCFLLL